MISALTASPSTCLQAWTHLDEQRASTNGASLEDGYCEGRMLKLTLQTDMFNNVIMSTRVVGRSLAKQQQRAGGRWEVSVAVSKKRSQQSIKKGQNLFDLRGAALSVNCQRGRRLTFDR